MPERVITLFEGVPNPVEDDHTIVLRRGELEHATTRIFEGRFEIRGIIKKGGMGLVYDAMDLEMGRPVAIKMPRSDVEIPFEEIEAFHREARITASLVHPSTVRVYERGETSDGTPYMVMERLRGLSLRDHIEAHGAIDELTALRWVRQIAEALVEAHEAGVVHCDLKPDNVFVEHVGVSEVVKVFDFGIAREPRLRASEAFEAEGARIIDTWLPGRERTTDTVVGTPQYMSPEQCQSAPLDARSDVYGLGCLLFTMVEGHAPFDGGSAPEVMHRHMTAELPWARRCGRRTAGLIRQAMRKDPEDRIDSAARFIRRVDENLHALRHEG